MTPLQRAARATWRHVSADYAACVIPFRADAYPLNGGTCVRWGRNVRQMIKGWEAPPGAEIVILAGRTLTSFLALGVTRGGAETIAVTGADRGREPLIYTPAAHIGEMTALVATFVETPALSVPG